VLCQTRSAGETGVESEDPGEEVITTGGCCSVWTGPTTGGGEATAGRALIAASTARVSLRRSSSVLILDMIDVAYAAASAQMPPGSEEP
jgi:hypothetical protein